MINEYRIDLTKTKTFITNYIHKNSDQTVSQLLVFTIGIDATHTIMKGYGSSPQKSPTVAIICTLYAQNNQHPLGVSLC